MHQNILSSGHTVLNLQKPCHVSNSNSFIGASFEYLDDLIVFNNKKLLGYLKEIYPSQLTVEKANKSDHLADYLDLTFIIGSGGKLSTSLYDKRDKHCQFSIPFQEHTICPFLWCVYLTAH